jgi:hypothetical protein
MKNFNIVCYFYLGLYCSKVPIAISSMPKSFRLLFLIFLSHYILLSSSCGLYYRLHKTKAEKVQLKADRKKEEEWEKKHKIQKDNQKRVMAMQSKDTRKRMKASRKKSDRINAGKPALQTKHYHIPRIFRPSKWWRK